jgi:hypothetical protein
VRNGTKTNRFKRKEKENKAYITKETIISELISIAGPNSIVTGAFLAVRADCHNFGAQLRT